jgi:diguanylate cyclase (GGDEF)-like protein
VLGSRAFKVIGVALLTANVLLFGWSLLARRAPVHSAVWDGWFINLQLLVPTLACVARAVVGGPRRAGAAWLAAAMLAFTVGCVIFVGWTQFQTDPAVPSPADIAYLVFYPCVIAAVFCLLRREAGAPARGLWLDGALGAAGAATGMAAVLSPALSGPTGDLGAAVMSAAFSVGDLLLVAMISGVAAVRGARSGSMWKWLAVGLATFCAADVAYALQVAANTYAVGTAWSSLWLVGLTIVAVGIWRPQRPAPLEAARSGGILAVPTVATITAVVVLVVPSFGRATTLVDVLAVLTLLLAGVRIFIGFRQVQRLSDAHRQAVTDDLTGVGNRRSLFEYGAQRLRDADTDAGERVALMLIDLDDFKEVNDALGHQAGDELLREMARRLAARLVPTDLLVRLGGDEFALVMTLAQGEDARPGADRVLERLAQPLVVEGTRVRVDASAGISESDAAASTISELLRRADVAMYAAKKNASARVQLYDPQLDEANHARIAMITDLDAALANHEFLLHYQPKIRVGTGATIGAEGLVRWQHPTRGLLHPDAFLALVEQSGLMSAMTRMVLEAAVTQLAAWRASDLQLSVAVNLSASDLLDEQLAERIVALLAEHDVPIGALQVEITESVLMTDPERARTMLEKLRRMGLRIAVDDYGTGYCALAYLRDLPIDELKIDRTFITDVTADPRSAAIVRSTVELAHALDLEVVAEGVEDQSALDLLADFGCDFAQGYHFSRPLPADEFAAWARRRGASAVTPGA